MNAKWWWKAMTATHYRVAWLLMNKQISSISCSAPNTMMNFTFFFHVFFSALVSHTFCRSGSIITGCCRCYCFFIESIIIKWLHICRHRTSSFRQSYGRHKKTKSFFLLFHSIVEIIVYDRWQNTINTVTRIIYELYSAHFV